MKYMRNAYLQANTCIWSTSSYSLSEKCPVLSNCGPAILYIGYVEIMDVETRLLPEVSQQKTKRQPTRDKKGFAKLAQT